MLGGQIIVNANFIGKNAKKTINSEEAIAKDQTDWERVDNMTDEELTQNALDDPDNPPLTDEELEQFEPVSSIEDWLRSKGVIQ